MEREKIEQIRAFIKIIPENLDFVNITLLLENLDQIDKNHEFFNPLFELKTLSLVYDVSVAKEDLIRYTDLTLGKEIADYFESNLRIVSEKVIQRVIKEVYNDGNLLIKNIDDYSDLCKLVAEYERPKAESGTPKSLNLLMSHLLDLKENESIYDCASGNGSSLLYAIKKTNNVYSQEINYESYIRQILIFKLLDFKNVTIVNENTLTNPIFINESVDKIICNPPFVQRIMDNMEINDCITSISGEQYKTNREADIYFYNLISKIVKKKAVFVAPSGLSFKQTKIAVAYKKWLVDNKYLDTVVQLPSGLFGPNTNVSTVLFVINKEKINEDVYMIDISESDFINKERVFTEIKEDKMNELVSMIQNKKEVNGLSVCVSSKTIEEAEWDLIPKRFIPFEVLSENKDLDCLLDERKRILDQLKIQIDKVNECLVKVQSLK